jgi:hypothetical protein
MPATIIPDGGVCCDETGLSPSVPVRDRVCAMTHERTKQAARNNAVWCDTVCRARGKPGEFLEGIWINRRETPRFYPNAVTLSEAVGTAAQLERVRELVDTGVSGDWGIKDSFSALDLAPLGFEVLFEATWIYRSASLPRPGGDITEARWARVGGASELARWEAAWRGAPAGEGATKQAPIFLPSMLMDSNVVVLAAYRKHRIVAGVIANRTGDVVGLSNVFVPERHPGPFRAGCVAAVIEAFPGLPIVGYERGRELAASQALGFELLGPVRIWARASGPV